MNPKAQVVNKAQRQLRPKSYFPEAEFKEFERRLKFKPRLKYGWFHLKFYDI